MSSNCSDSNEEVQGPQASMCQLVALGSSERQKYPWDIGRALGASAGPLLLKALIAFRMQCHSLLELF